MNTSTFIYSPLLYWINMQRCHVINAAIKIGPPTVVTNTEMKVHISDCLWESEIPECRGYGLRGSSPRAETPVAMQAALVVLQLPLSNQMPQCQTRSPFPIPIFQEIPFAQPLHKMPPMLEHTLTCWTAFLNGMSTTIPFQHWPLNELFQCQAFAPYL